MIMQSAPSPFAVAFIMGLDVHQGIFAIKVFADRHSEPSTPRNQLFQEAERLLATAPEPASTPQLIEDRSEDQEKQKRILDSALRLANTAESILLVEYYKVIIPIVNGLFLLVASQFSSAQYNSRIAPFYHNPDNLTSALSSVILYSLLQGLSCVAMHLVMKHRYGISVAAHIAFVLERYHQSILGMMLAWLPLILHFTLMHYGPDFSFRFRMQDDSW